jgi:hypothetical protein
MGRGILGEVAATKKPLRVDDVRLDPRHDATVDRQTGFTTKSLSNNLPQWFDRLTTNG